MSKQDVIFTQGMFCKEHVFPDGGTITKLSFKVDEFIAWLNAHRNADGFVNAIVTKSQTSGKLYGKLDTWKPEKQAPQQDYNQDNQHQENQPQSNNNQNNEQDDIPF